MASTRHPSDINSKAAPAVVTLTPRGTTVTDPLFASNSFFKSSDQAQLKYEMVRRVEVDGQSVTETAAAFGFSRPAFYAAQAALARGGLLALAPQRPGPRRRHKLRPEIVAALHQARATEPRLPPSELAGRIDAQFGVRLHRRTIERIVGPRPKLRTPPSR
jgi:transposase